VGNGGPPSASHPRRNQRQPWSQTSVINAEFHPKYKGFWLSKQAMAARNKAQHQTELVRQAVA